MSQEIRVAGIIKESITDGPGLRYALFVQGCPHGCIECHNPETWDFNGGRLKSAEEIFAEITKNPLVHGVTFSGGEPFCQATALAYLADMLKQNGYELAVYTGFRWEELTADDEMMKLVRLSDVVVDGRFECELKDISLVFKGSSNQRIINVEKSLEEGSVVLEASARWCGK